MSNWHRTSSRNLLIFELNKIATMKKIILVLIIVFNLLVLLNSCKKKADTLLTRESKNKLETQKETKLTTLDSTLIASFFDNHSLLKKYQSDVEILYKKHNYNYIWYSTVGINEVGKILHDKINNINEEGILTTIPYKTDLDTVIKNSSNAIKYNSETELLLSSLYFFYTDKVFIGIDSNDLKKIEWYLPPKKQSYQAYLDSVLKNPSIFSNENRALIGQYYQLKKTLKAYRDIEKKGGWDRIIIDTSFKSIKLGDSTKTISQIRSRLFVSKDIKRDSKSSIYDDELKTGVLNYKKRNGFIINSTLSLKHIASMNVSVADRIKTIIINMERCRWIPNYFTTSKEYIAINIPSYKLTYIRDGKPELFSKVVVGKSMHKTVIFSAKMKYIVFSPYWNVPTSIIKNEIKPAMAKNSNYLEEHDMEWNDGNVRQRPGPKNSLGLVKFLFPNSNAIYLHDTPTKNLFNEEKRAFSHGCIRIEKPKELAIAILKNDIKWTPENIEAAMKRGTESWYTLKSEIPVYIGYFTAWVDSNGNINFYDDVYHRDNTLAKLIFIE